jgi:anti-sigma-K factor RskA
MNHSEMDELYDLYLMGVLESEQAAEIASHLDRNCEHCTSQIEKAQALIGSLASLVELRPPPPKLRERVLAIANPVRVKRSVWPAAFALACAASAGLLFWGTAQRRSFDGAVQQLQEMRRQRNVQFGQAPDSPHGRVFLSRNGGIVFLGSHLPGLPQGKTFELWLVPPKGNPQAAGLFTPNSQGISVNVLARSVDPARFAAVAVSVEPNGGSPQPTSKPILVIPLG